jgi:putative ABC transport system permease protein
MRPSRLGRTEAGLTARSIWQRPWLSLVVFLTAALAAAAAAAGPMYNEAARTAIVRNAFAQAPVDAQGIVFEWDRPYRTPPTFLDETPEATGIPEAFGSPIRSAAITSDILDQTGRVKLVWREGSCARLVLVTGRCPSSPGEVVASEATRSRYDWEIGSQIFLSALVPLEPPDTADNAPTLEALPLTVVGTYELPDPEESFWLGIEFFPQSTATSDVNPAAGRRNDPLITEESTLEWSGRADAVWEFSVTLLLEIESLVAEDAEALRAAPTQAREWAAGQLQEWSGARASVFTDMGRIAFEAIREQESLNVSVVVVSLELVGLIWLLLFLAVSDLVRARRLEIGLARLRGLSRFQVWRFGLGEPVTLLVLALPVGVMASIPIVGMLSGWLLDSDIEVSAGWQAWLAAAGGVLGGLVAAALAARSTLTMSVMEQWRSPPSDARHRSWVVDAVVIALVAVGLVELMSAGLITEPSGGDVTALLVPALLAIALALLAARALPYIGRLMLRATDRRSGIGFFLGLRHAVRSRDTTSMLIVLTMAFSLATFALAAWAVTVRNHRDVATVHNGAPTVLVVTPPEGSRLIELVANADPRGQSAVPVAIYDRTARLLAVDTERFPQVANWRADFTEVPLADLLPQLRPPSAPPVTLSGDEIRITIDSRRVTAPEWELTADLELPSLIGPFRLHLEESGRAQDVVLKGRLPNACHNVCELRGITVLTSLDTDGGSSRAELVINKIEVHSDAGWRTIDAGLTKSGRWRAEGSSFRIPAATTTTANGLVMIFETGDLARAVVATHPPSLPAITLGAIGPRPVGREVGGLDGGIQEVEVVAEALALPGATGPTALVDYETAEHAAFGLANGVEHQVWVTSAAAAKVKDSLQDQGVLVTTERTVSELERQFNREGPGLALALLLVMAAVGAILAMARAGISLYAAGRQRSYQFAVLSAIGASEPAQRAAILIEQAITLGAGVLAGAVAGIAAAAIALRRIPQFTTPPATPPLTFTLDPLVVAGALGISALAVSLVVVLTTEAIRRSVGIDRLRQAAP